MTQIQNQRNDTKTLGRKVFYFFLCAFALNLLRMDSKNPRYPLNPSNPRFRHLPPSPQF